MCNCHNFFKHTLLTDLCIGINDACLVSDGEQLISCSCDGKLKLWDTESGTCLRTINPNRGGLTALDLLNNKNSSVFISF